MMLQNITCQKISNWIYGNVYRLYYFLQKNNSRVKLHIEFIDMVKDFLVKDKTWESITGRIVQMNSSILPCYIWISQKYLAILSTICNNQYHWTQQLKRDGTVEQLQTSHSGNLPAEGLKTRKKNLHM